MQLWPHVAARLGLSYGDNGEPKLSYYYNGELKLSYYYNGKLKPTSTKWPPFPAADPGPQSSEPPTLVLLP